MIVELNQRQTFRQALGENYRLRRESAGLSIWDVSNQTPYATQTLNAFEDGLLSAGHTMNHLIEIYQRFGVRPVSGTKTKNDENAVSD